MSKSEKSLSGLLHLGAAALCPTLCLGPGTVDKYTDMFVDIVVSAFIDFKAFTTR